MPMFLSSRMSLALLSPEVSGGQGHLQARQGQGLLLQRHNGWPGFGYEATQGQRCRRRPQPCRGWRGPRPREASGGRSDTGIHEGNNMRVMTALKKPTAESHHGGGNLILTPRPLTGLGSADGLDPLIHFEPKHLCSVVRGDLPSVLLGGGGEDAVEKFSRLRPGGFGMREIVSPQYIVHANDVAE